MGLRQRLKTWSDERSPWARARQRAAEQRELLAALPLPVAHRALERLLDRDLAIDPREPGYTVWLVAALDGLTLGDELVIAHGPLGDATLAEPTAPDAMIVGVGEVRCFYTLGGSLAVHVVGESAPVAPSLAHLVLGSVLATKDLRVLVNTPSQWAPQPRHRRRVSGASRRAAPANPFELDARSRQRALIGSLLALAVPVLLCGTSMVFPSGACCAAVVAFGFASAFALAASVRLEEILVLEPRLRAMAPDADGFTHAGVRYGWGELAELKPGASTCTLVLRDGQSVVLGYSGFRHPEAAARAIALACATKGAPRYRDR